MCTVYGDQSHRRESTARSFAPTLSISLIFGLPARRNRQPGVPPLGAISDYVSFIWAENIVAVSAIVIMGTWLRRSRRSESGRIAERKLVYPDGCIRIPAEIVEAAPRRRIAGPLAASGPRDQPAEGELDCATELGARESSNFVAAVPGA